MDKYELCWSQRWFGIKFEVDVFAYCFVEFKMVTKVLNYLVKDILEYILKSCLK